MKSKRNSNVELLRIIAMAIIVAGHLLSQGGEINNFVNSIISIYLGSGARIAVNIFLFIGVYFMVDSKYKTARVLNLWGELFFYSILFTIIAVIIGHNISIKNLVKAILPFSTRALWFASSYIILLLLHPYLKKFFDLSKEKSKFLVVFLSFVMIIMSTFSEKQADFITNTSWFLYIYLLIGWLKKYTNIFNKRENWLQKYGILFAIFIYLILTTTKSVSIISGNGMIKSFSKLSAQYLSDIKSIPNFMCGFCLFVDVITHKPKHSKIINCIARPTFAVYIIHQTPAFFPILWKNILKTGLWFSTNSIYFCIGIISSIALIFLVCGILDYYRQKLVEPRFQKSTLYNQIMIKCDSIIN